MKKILPIIALALIIPQIASAAWWNPFSWNIFKKSNSQTKILEDRIKQLEKKLDESTKINATTTKKASDIKQEQKKTTDNFSTETKQIPQTPPASMDYGNSLKLLLEEYMAFKRQVEIDIDQFQDVRIENPYYDKRYYYVKDFLNNLSYTMRGLENLLNDTKPKTAEVVNFYKIKLTELKNSYKFTITDYADQALIFKDNEARSNLIDYIKTNKNNLYITSYHIKAAAAFDIYDRMFGTKYAAPFRATKSQTEVIEFVNSFLLDIGEFDSL